MRKLILTVVFVVSVNLVSQAQDMDFKSLKLVLAQRAVVLQEVGNSVQYNLDGVQIYLITDESANRMRLMAGVVKESDLSQTDLATLLEANFDRALDAKYALSDGVLWSVFTHPLKELEKEQVIDAFYQVKNLVNNYGSTYNSTDFLFGGSDN